MNKVIEILHYKGISSSLLKWYQKNKRKLPWRESFPKDPYKIWVSEIILQQTRIDQGLPYYHAFLNRFPDIFKLSQASEDEVLKLWQGLGYYSRARNMHHTARVLASHYGGNFPYDRRELLRLKGIGEYTASLISSVCFGQPYPVLDGNVYRVLSRLSASSKPVNSAEGKKFFLQFAEKLIDESNPGDFNEAMMDLGATVCLPQNPICKSCPLNSFCSAFQVKSQDKFPVKTPKKPLKNRYLHYFLVKDKDSIVLVKRRENDIWKNMYQFPLIEKPVTGKVKHSEINQNFHLKSLKLKFLYSKIHILTHRKLHIYFYLVTGFEFLTDLLPQGWLMVPYNQIINYALPKPVEEAVNTVFKAIGSVGKNESGG